MNAIARWFRSLTFIDLIGFCIVGALVMPVVWWLGWPGFIAFTAGELAQVAIRIFRSDDRGAS